MLMCSRQITRFQSQEFSFWRNSPQWVRASSFTRFPNHTQRRPAVGRTPLDEWSARRRDLWQHTTLTTERHPCPGGIRTHNLSRRAAADLRLRPRSHWDRQSQELRDQNKMFFAFLRFLCKYFRNKAVPKSKQFIFFEARHPRFVGSVTKNFLFITHTVETKLCLNYETFSI